MGRIKITKAQMARLVENKTDHLIEIAAVKGQLDKKGRKKDSWNNNKAKNTIR